METNEQARHPVPETPARSRGKTTPQHDKCPPFPKQFIAYDHWPTQDPDHGRAQNDQNHAAGSCPSDKQQLEGAVEPASPTQRLGSNSGRNTYSIWADRRVYQRTHGQDSHSRCQTHTNQCGNIARHRAKQQTAPRSAHPASGQYKL